MSTDFFGAVKLLLRIGWRGVAKILVCLLVLGGGLYLVLAFSGFTEERKLSAAIEILRSIDSSPVPADSRAASRSAEIKEAMRNEVAKLLAPGPDHGPATEHLDQLLRWFGGWPYLVGFVVGVRNRRRVGKSAVDDPMLAAAFLFLVATAVGASLPPNLGPAFQLIVPPVGVFVAATIVAGVAQGARKKPSP